MGNIYFSAFLLGFVSISSQIILLRELLVSFSGNELSIGIIIALWMLFSGIGALIAKNRTVPFFAAAILPLALALSRLTGTVLVFKMGTVLFISCAVLIPPALVFGIWFRMCSFESGNAPKVYFYESIGAIAGAFAAGALFIPLLSAFQTIFILSALCILGFPHKKWRSSLFHFLLFLIVISAIFAAGIPSKLENISSAMRWKPFTLASSLDTIYGKLAVLKIGDAASFYENGAKIASTSEKQYAEEITYFSMLSYNSRPDPKILLIGGSVSGILPELLKYNPAEIVVLEIDPGVVALGSKFLGTEEKAALKNPRVKIINKDGREFVRKAASGGTNFDCIIVSLSDPVSGLVNRFFTLEFFRDIRKIMPRDGIFTVSISAPAEFVSAELGVLSTSIHKTLGAAFENVIVIPGVRSYFIASGLSLSDSPDFFINRASKSKIKPLYLNPEYVKYLLKPDRLGNFKLKLFSFESGRVDINTDMKPVSYFYGLIYWVSRAAGRVPKAFYLIRGSPAPLLALFSFAAMLLMFFRLQKKGRHDRLAVSVSVGLIGASSMLVELAVIFAFQAVFGYIYYLISFLLASFMLGLALGARSDKIRLPRPAFYSSVFLAVFAIVLPLVFNERTPFFLWPVIMLLAGVPVGSAFNSANTLLSGSAGLIYGADLWGAAAAALIGSAVFFPVFGIPFTCLIAAAAAAIASLSFSFTPIDNPPPRVIK